MMFFDPLYFLIVGPAMLLAFWAQVRVKSTYTHWAAQPNSARMSGEEAARAMLQSAGLNLNIELAGGGQLSDHYDPRTRTLRLSPDVFHGRSVAALGIACHEAGHALQHADQYLWLTFRSRVVPLANVGSWLAWPMIILGMILSSAGLLMAGILAFSLLVLFQIVTLPVEFDASARAKQQLESMGIVRNATEAAGVSKVLRAAAMTYVAATATAVATLLYFILRSGLLRRN